MTNFLVGVGRRFALASIVYFASTAVAGSQGNGSRDDINNWSPGKLRSRGEEAFSLRKFDEALKFYEKAAEKEPDNGVNFYKLFRVHNRMKKFANALTDVEKALELDPTNSEWRIQKAKLLKSLGQCDRSVVEYKTLTENNTVGDEVQTLLQEALECEQVILNAQQALLNEEYDIAAHYFTAALKYADGRATDLLLQKATAVLETGDYYSVISDTGQILKAYPKHLEAYRLRGMAYLWLNDHDIAIQHFREGLKLDPEHKGCKEGHKLVKKIDKKKKKGDVAFEAGNYEEAIQHYTGAIEIEPEHENFVRLTQFLIVQAYSKDKKHTEAIRIAQEILEDDDEALDALWALGDALIDAEKYQEALKIFRQAYEAAPDDGEDARKAKNKYQEAEVALKQSKEKNYYKILGISRTATKQDIKKAYRKLAMEWHPDKNLDNKEEAELKFQDISEANEVLSDEELKGKYDRGEAVYDNQGGGSGRQRQHFDPSQFFRQAQGGGGGHQRQHTFHFNSF